jgi:hypothetical protein
MRLGASSPEDFQQADATYTHAVAHRAPRVEDWVLEVSDEGGHHARLAWVALGGVMSFQGRLLQLGAGEVRATGGAVSGGPHVRAGGRSRERCRGAFRRWVDRGTPEHPFYAPEVGKYVSLRHLEVGARLHTLGGGAAVLVGKTWRQGGVEVFNLEVDGGHNFFAGGVLTHNAKNCGGGGSCPALPPSRIVDAGEIIIEHYFFGEDHGPAHAHVVGGGPKTRIGPLGFPLQGDPELSPRQKRVVEQNRGKIRKCINKIGRWRKWRKDNGFSDY